MQLNFTQEDLIRFVYKETSPQENIDILKALDNDISLKNSLNEILEVLGYLNELKYEPSETTLKILNEEANSSSLEMS